MKRVISMLAAGGLLSGAVFAQEKKVVKEVVEDVVIVNSQASHAAGAGPLVVTQFYAGRGNVKGAPYAAEAVNESTQTLADGTRITNKNTTKMYRDSEGRTRMESSFTPVGNWVPEGGAGSMVTIMDPVAGEHITLNSMNKSAFRNKMPNARMAGGAASGGSISHSATAGNAGENKEIRIEMRRDARTPGSVTIPDVPAGGNVMFFREGQPLRMPMQGTDIKTDSLGKQTIEGVQCEGVKETATIATGAMGNDRPIVITTERWTSTELGIEMLRKHSDPRTGEVVYRVTMLQRGEQPRSLFEVPADYKTQDVPKTIQWQQKIEHKDNI